MGSMPRTQIKNKIRYRKGSTCNAANCERCVHFTPLDPGAVVPSQAKGLCGVIGAFQMNMDTEYRLKDCRVRADYRCDMQEYDGHCKDKKC